MNGEVFKRPLRRMLSRAGFKLVRVERTFGLDPLVDINYYFPEKPIVTVVDVGACIGSFTVKVVKRLPGARVLAFEPIRSTFEKLESNTAALGNVRPFHLALGDREGEETMYLQDHSEWNSLAETVNRPAAPRARRSSG